MTSEHVSIGALVPGMLDAALQVLNDPASDWSTRAFARSIVAACETYERNVEHDRQRASRVRLDAEFVADNMDFPPAPDGGLGTD